MLPGGLLIAYDERGKKVRSRMGAGGGMPEHATQLSKLGLCIKGVIWW